MSVNLLLNNALSGIGTNQAALREVSNNIANVNTEGYARRTIQQEAVSIAGQAAGVGIAEIRRVVDSFFTERAVTATSDASRYEAEARIHDRIQSMLGRPDDPNTLPGRVNTALTSIADVLIDPSSSVRRADFLSDVRQMADSFHSMSTQIQNIRLDIDNEIKSEVDNANRLLERIENLNTDIQRSTFSGNETSTLVDQRDVAISELAEFVQIRAVSQSDGTVQISTPDGFSLVGGGRATLSYDNPGVVSAETGFPAISVTRQTATGVTVGTAQELDSHVVGGKLKGLLQMRDVDLPNLATQIGELAGVVADELNAVHNDGISYPAPNTLTGRQTGLLPTDALSFTGATTLAVVDADGTLVRRVDIDFDAGTLSVDGGGASAIGATVTAWASALDTALSGVGEVDFADGVLSVDADDADHGVGFLQDAANPSDLGGRGFAHYFGLNDLLRADAPSHFDTGLAVGAAHGFTAGETLDLTVRGPDGSEARSVEITIAGTTFTDILSSLNNATSGLGGIMTFGIDATTGAMTVTPASGFESHVVQVSSDGTERGSTSVSLSQLFGFGGAPQARQATNVALTNEVASDSAKLALAKLDISGATVVGDVVVSQSDNRAALELQAIQGTSVAFSSAGNLKAANATIGNYAGLVFSNAGNSAANAQARSDSATALSTEVEARKAEVQGVNLDEELSNMIIYQQAYNASARMMSASQELFDTLLRIV